MINTDHQNPKGATTMAKKNIEELEAPAEVTTFSPKDLATILDTDPKSFRRWLRKHTDNRAGKGGRWAFDAETANALIEAFRTPEPEDDAEDLDED